MLRLVGRSQNRALGPNVLVEIIKTRYTIHVKCNFYLVTRVADYRTFWNTERW